MVEQAEVMRDVVGGGVAGLSVALILARLRRRVTVVDAGAPRNAPPQAARGLRTLDGLSPLELFERSRDEVTCYGGEIVSTEAGGVSGVSLGSAVTQLSDSVGLVVEDTDRAIARLTNAQTVR